MVHSNDKKQFQKLNVIKNTQSKIKLQAYVKVFPHQIAIAISKNWKEYQLVGRTKNKKFSF